MKSTSHFRRLLFILAAFAPLTPAVRAEDRIVEQSRALVAPYIETNRVIGLSIGLIQGDQRRILHFGKTATNEDAAAPDDGTLYEIGSVTKTLTTLLLAEEAAKGNLKLDDPVAKLVPGTGALSTRAPAPANGAPSRPITLADLATHHSGLVRIPTNFKPADPLDPYANYTAAKFTEFLRETKLTAAPGARYDYSNAGSALLGHALAVHLKTDYDKLLTQRIFKPLAMADSAITLSPAQQARFAKAHNIDGWPVKPWTLNFFNPAGGVRSNVVDMLHYTEAQLGRRKSPLDKAIELSHRKIHDLPGGSGIALGWHIAPDKNTLWHNGHTGGFYAFVAFNKKLDIAVILLSNTGNAQLDQLAMQLMAMLAGHETVPVTFPKVIDIDPKTLAKYTGTYALSPAFAITITQHGKVLRAQATGQDPFTLFPETETRFNYRVVEATISFQVDDDGSINQLTLHQNGLNMPGKRVADKAR